MPEKSQQTDYRIEALGKQHDRKSFSCGVEPLDRYLREQARQDARKRIAARFVLCIGQGNAVFGYYTLSALSVDVGRWPEDVARKLPRYPVVPATLLGRLALDRSLRGKGAGEHLLIDALRRSLEATRGVASAAVVVDAKDENRGAFYRHYGFLPFADARGRLFLQMATLAELFAK
ncbi:MAG: GNAT family N-acetyltransferase [Vicinamibacteria bacterium]